MHPMGLTDDWADKMAGQDFLARNAKSTFEHYLQVGTSSPWEMLCDGSCALMLQDGNGMIEWRRDQALMSEGELPQAFCMHTSIHGCTVSYCTCIVCESSHGHKLWSGVEQSIGCKLANPHTLQSQGSEQRPSLHDSNNMMP